MFEDVSLPGAAAEPFEETAALADAAAMLDHRRQPGHQPLVEAGELVGRRILQRSQIDPGLQHGKIGPVVRAAQNQHFPKFHGSLTHGCPAAETLFQCL